MIRVLTEGKHALQEKPKTFVELRAAALALAAELRDSTDHAKKRDMCVHISRMAMVFRRPPRRICF
jgi:hypothetical protein